MEEIVQWLQSEAKDYYAGIELLRPHTKNRTLINNLGRKENSMNKEKLQYELTKLVGAAAIESLAPAETDTDKATTISVETVVAKPIPAPQAVEGIEGNDDYLLGIVKKLDELYLERTKISNTLADLTSDVERKEAVDKIEELRQQHIALSEHKEYYMQTGNKPVAAQEPEAQLSEADLLRKKKSLIEKKSRLNRVLEAKPDDVEKQTELAQVEASLEDINLSLKLMKGGGIEDAN